MRFFLLCRRKSLVSMNGADARNATNLRYYSLRLTISVKGADITLQNGVLYRVPFSRYRSSP